MLSYRGITKIVQKIEGMIFIDPLILQNDNVILRMVNSGIEYGNEYVGNFSPLVATPTSDRCYRSFFMAFKYNLGITY